MTVRPNEVALKHWMAYHMWVDLCLVLICPIRSGPELDACKGVYWTSLETFLEHLAGVHRELKSDLIKRWGPGTNEPRADNKDSLHHLLCLQLFGTNAQKETAQLRALQTPICGMMRRYFRAISYPLKKQVPHILSEADSQKAFHIAWSYGGYQGLRENAPTERDLVAVSQNHKSIIVRLPEHLPPL